VRKTALTLTILVSNSLVLPHLSPSLLCRTFRVSRTGCAGCGLGVIKRRQPVRPSINLPVRTTLPPATETLFFFLLFHGLDSLLPSSRSIPTPAFRTFFFAAFHPPHSSKIICLFNFIAPPLFWQRKGDGCKSKGHRKRKPKVYFLSLDCFFLYSFEM